MPTNETTLKTRIQLKRGTYAQWEAVKTTFVPKDGELIIYEKDTNNPPRLKVGDGTTKIGSLPFIGENVAKKIDSFGNIEEETDTTPLEEKYYPTAKLVYDEIGKLTNKDTELKGDIGELKDELQSQIDAITLASDVVDVVGTKSALNSYAPINNTYLTKNDVIKVLADESQEGKITYYRATGTTQTGTNNLIAPYNWQLIGALGPYYTTTEIENIMAPIVPINNFIGKNGVALDKDTGNTTIEIGLIPKTDTTVHGPWTYIFDCGEGAE